MRSRRVDDAQGNLKVPRCIQAQQSAHARTEDTFKHLDVILRPRPSFMSSHDLAANMDPNQGVLGSPSAAAAQLGVD